MVLGKELEQLLAGAEGREYVASIMRRQAEARIQEMILPEISEYTGRMGEIQSEITINKNGEVEILLYTNDSIGRYGEREYYKILNQRLRNLFDEISGRYGVRILGFGKREWESGFDWSKMHNPECPFSGMKLSEVLGIEE